MKKFFSLVLALVMALSLTTVAWGATTVSTEADLLAALAPDAEIVLGANIELNAKLNLPNGVTLDGAGYTISIAGATWDNTNDGKHLLGLGNDTTVKNVTLDSENLAYGVQAYCVTGVKFDNVTIKSSVGAGLTVNGATVEAVNLKASGNAWGSVNVDPGSGVISESKFTVSGSNTNLADTAGSIWSDGTNVTTGNEVDVTISGGTYAGDIDIPAAAGTAAVSGGTFSTDVSKYVADGSRFDAATGEVTAMPAAGVGKYDLYDEDSNLTEENITAEFVKAYKNKTTGAGNIAYYKLTWGGTTHSYFVECDRPDADCYLTLADNKGVYMYLEFVDEVNYFAAAKSFNNIGDECGELDLADPDDDAYVTYDAKGVPSYWVEAIGTGTWVLFDGECVEVADAGALVAHTWVVTAYNDDEEPTTAKCKECPATAKLYATKLAAPVGSVFETAKVAGYWVVVDKAPAATTDKVQSAETFDAGIAMYVGMSVMAAAGSAVVIGKKKD
ncbi:MAG: hypothetical protein IJE94_05715 [Oscillospiraceae bacterium]|nr:hypothetical protein [Oscillospiraceae bacterium]